MKRIRVSLNQEEADLIFRLRNEKAKDIAECKEIGKLAEIDKRPLGYYLHLPSPYQLKKDNSKQE